MAELRLERSHKSQKVSITMPEGLHSRLEAVRDKFNISSVCQQALEKEIKIHELVTKGDDMDAIVERLKLQKSQQGVDSRQKGIEDGIGWAKEMSYQELRAMERFRVIMMDPLHYKDLTVKWLGTSSIKEVMQDWYGMDKIKEEFEEHLGVEINLCSEYDTREYFIGWLIGVFEFYHEIEEKIGAIPFGEGIEVKLPEPAVVPTQS